MKDSLPHERISEFMQVTMGQSPPSETYNQERKGIPFFQGITDFGDIYPVPRYWCSSPQKMANENEILFSVRAPVGEVNLSKEKSCIGRGIASLKPKNSDLRYCFYLLQEFKHKFSSHSQGTTFEAINRDDISNVMLPYIKNIKEQQKIAFILSKLDELIQKKDQIIEQTQRLKKGLMQRLLSKGIGHTKFKKTELGEIPEEWQIIYLQKIVNSFKNGIYKPDKFYGRGYPSLRMYNISNGKINTSNLQLLEVTEQELVDFGLKEDDILINRVNSVDLVGKAGIIEEGLGNATFESKNIRIRLNRDLVVPHFVNLFLNSKYYFNQIHAKTKAAIGQSTINQDDLCSIRIALPPIKEQEKISRIILKIENRHDYQLREIKYFKILKKGLMQQLLTGKIRVKV